MEKLSNAGHISSAVLIHDDSSIWTRATQSLDCKTLVNEISHQGTQSTQHFGRYYSLSHKTLLSRFYNGGHHAAGELPIVEPDILGSSICRAEIRASSHSRSRLGSRAYTPELHGYAQRVQEIRSRVSVACKES